VEEFNIKIFKAIRKQFLQQALDYQKQHKNSKLTSCCRPTVSLDPDLWLSMTRKNVADAKDGALDGCLAASPCPCPLYPNQTLTKTHAIQCLNMHNRLQISSTMKEPLSFLLDLLPIKLPCSSHTVALGFFVGQLHIQSYLSRIIFTTIDTCVRPPHGQLLLNWLLKY
jgi:hypothetical protein